VTDSDLDSTPNDSDEVAFNFPVDVLTPDTLERTIRAWRSLLESSGKDAGGTVLATWEVTYLEVSSLHARYAPVAERPEFKSVVLQELRGVATSIAQGNGALTAGPFAKAAKELIELSKIAPTEMTILDREITISAQAAVEIVHPLRSIGSVEGRVLMVSKRRGLNCTLYDEVNNSAIHCKVPLSMEDEVREAFDRRVLIAGTITRHPLTGLAQSIAVTQIERLIYGRGDYRKARAIFKDVPGRPPLEDLIRKISDAS
jgi:hypothetical protein